MSEAKYRVGDIVYYWGASRRFASEPLRVAAVNPNLVNGWTYEVTLVAESASRSKFFLHRLESSPWVERNDSPQSDSAR